MKKFTLLLMVAILACLVMAAAVGCGDRNTPQDDNTQTQEPYEPTDEEIQAAIERYAAEYGGIEYICVNSISIKLTLDATREFKTYTADDFKELGECWVGADNQKIANYVEAKLKGLPVEKEYDRINPETYQHAFGLQIVSSTVEGVVRACLILEKRPDVETARPASNIIYDSENTNSTTPTDWASYINVAAAWALTEGSEDVLVGVMDTGIDEGKMSVETTA